MKIVISGATSFLGVELTKLFLRRGDDIIAICRKNSYRLKDLPPSVTIIYADMHEYKELHNYINHSDVFIHLSWAGTTHEGRDQLEIQQLNIQHSLDLMNVASKVGARLFVTAGSQAEYGVTNCPQVENMICNPFSEYGKAKLDLSKKGADFAKSLHLKYMHLRIFSLYGEFDHPWTLVMQCMEKMQNNIAIELSNCTQNWNYLYVVDAAHQIAKLCDYAINNSDFINEIYNIASDDTRELKEYVERIKLLLCSRSDLQYGAINPDKIVSLQPNMDKTRQIVGILSHHTFDEIITNMKRQ